VREQLVAWAGDCVVRGVVELGDGRVSDQVNELDVVTFFDASHVTATYAATMAPYFDERIRRATG